MEKAADLAFLLPPPSLKASFGRNIKAASGLLKAVTSGGIYKAALALRVFFLFFTTPISCSLSKNLKLSGLNGKNGHEHEVNQSQGLELVTSWPDHGR